MEHAVIAGASIAGIHAARTLRKEGFSGAITVVDADARPPYDKPPLSKQVLAGAWDADRIALQTADEDLDVEWRLGHVLTGLDLVGRKVRLADGDALSYDGLVIATGASPRRLPGQPALRGVHVLRSLDDCLALRQDLEGQPARVVVVGAGFIGAEVAATCRQRGLDVTLLEMAAVPLERALGPEIGQVCAALHRDNGVDLRLGTGVQRIEGAGHVERVVLADGTTIDASVVIVGVGVVPNTSWLEGSGLTLDNGVVCDDTLLAADGVVAAGDVARWPSRRFGMSLRVEHWENAVQQGEAAARRLLGARETFDPVPWFWSDQYDRKIQLAGLSSADDDVEVVVGSLTERRFVALYGRNGRVVGVLGMNRPRHVMQLRRLVLDGVEWDDGLRQAREMA